jgi:pteridine reductase
MLVMTKVALVTGGGSGLGAVMSEHLHQQGYAILVHYHYAQEAAEALVKRLNQQRLGSAFAMGLDFEVGDVTGLIDACITHWGRLDVLLNNASGFYPTPIGAVTEQDWDTLFASNAKAPFFLSQSASPYLKKNKGLIINISDARVYHQQPMPDYAVYAMAKACLLTQTHVLAKALAPDVRVNTIAPGNMTWPDGKNRLSSAQKEKIIQAIPLKALGGHKAMVRAVDYLLHAAFVTGEVLCLDGGRNL